MDPLWRIELLGSLRAVSATQVLVRFRSHKTGALLGYLAFHRDRAHPRELLTEILWPEEPQEAARMKLRTALASLRRQLEPPGVPGGVVIDANRLSVRLNPAAVVTDVDQLEHTLDALDNTSGLDEQARCLDEAIALFRGPLLPGYFEAWVLPEQQHLSERYLQAVLRLVQRLERADDLPRAIVYAGRAVAADPLREEARHELMRLYAAAGQPAAALRQYQELERLLHEELGQPPSAATRALAEALRDDTETPSAPHPRLLSTRAAGPGVKRPTTTHKAREPETGHQSPPDRPLTALPVSPAVPLARALPLPPNRFLGREAEISRLRKLLLSEGVRLVTLTGPGGCGKTRLVLEAAARLHDALDGTVWFVPLADLSDPGHLIDAIHGALGLSRSTQTPPLQQVVDALSRRPALLVLDDMEQLLPGGGSLVHDLLARTPLLQCLVTSRQILELTPEREIAVGPLPVPGAQVFRRAGVQEGLSQPLNAQDHHYAAVPPEHLSALAANESVALFIDRAQRSSPDFQLTSGNAAAVAELCRRLEGIPLALEFAAARANRLAPSRMLAELERRFDLLVSRRRDLPSRHQTLRAALDWSYHLLPPDLQRFFARLFVFRGGFTREAASAVACPEPGSEDRLTAPVGEYLSHLLNNSLALSAASPQRDGSEQDERFRLLETVREYAAEQLFPEERDSVAEQHARYYLTLTEAIEPDLREGARRKEWLDRLEPEHDNLRAALDWAQDHVRMEIGVPLAVALMRFWVVRGYLEEGRARYLELLQQPELAAPTVERARVLTALALIAERQGTCDLGIEYGKEAVAILRRVGDSHGLAAALHILGGLASSVEDYAADRRYGAEALALFQALENKLGIARALSNLGLSSVLQGHYEEGRELLQQALQLNQERGDPLTVSYNLNSLGLAAVRQGRTDEAASLLARSLHIKRDMGNKEAIPYGLEGLAEVAAARGQPVRAVRLLAAARAAREAVGHPLYPMTERVRYQNLLASARAELGDEAFAAAWSEGQAWSLAQMVLYATREIDGSSHEPSSRSEEGLLRHDADTMRE